MIFSSQKFVRLWIAPCLLILQLTSPTDAAEQLWGSWNFAQTNLQQDTFKSTAGTLPAHPASIVTFETTKPGALQFDGKKQLILLSDDLPNAKLPSEALSVEAWVTVDKPLKWGGIAGAIQDNGSYERGWLLGFRDSRFCFAVATTKTSQLTYLTSPNDFAPGSWYHVAGTYDGKEMVLYVDGQVAARSTAQTGPIAYPPKGKFVAGAYVDDNESYLLTGRIAELEIAATASSPEQIARTFEAKKDRFPGVVAIEIASTPGWPTYMHDQLRTGRTPEKLTLPLSLQWVWQGPTPSPAWPPPANQDFWHDKHSLKARVTYDRANHLISDGEHVYLGSSTDDQVRCLDIKTGQQQWTFFTEGPVRLAPTLDDGRLYFGSDDGFVYCISAADGKLIWKQSAAEKPDRLPGNERIISTWPVRTGTYVDQGQVRVTAGLFPNQGTYQVVFDAETGKILNRTPLNMSPQGYLKRQGSGVVVSQGRAPSTILTRLARTGKTTQRTADVAPTEFPYAMIASPNLQFAGGDGKVAIITAKDGKTAWTADVTGKAYSLAIAGGSLLVSTDQGVVYCFGKGKSKPLGGEPRRVFPTTDANITKNFSEAAETILENLDAKLGYCLVMNAGDGRLCYELAKRSKLQIIGVESDAMKVAAARRAIDQAGYYGSIAIHHSTSARLPYTDSIFNLVVSDGQLGDLTPTQANVNEIARLVRPEGGVAAVKMPLTQDLTTQEESAVKLEAPFTKSFTSVSTTLVKEWAFIEVGSLPGVGQWTHMYAEPGNTACSNDKRVSGEMQLQWFGRPGPQQMLDRHHRTVPPLYSGGRLFIPGNDRFYGVDAYNGTVLWNVEIPDSRRVAAVRDSGNAVATSTHLYVATAGYCWKLNAATGNVDAKFSVPAKADGERHWGYIANVGDQLFGSVTNTTASQRGHSRKQINEAYWDFIPIVTSESFFSVDRQTGIQQWKYVPAVGAIITPTIAIGDGRVYFVESSNKETLTNGRDKLADLTGKGCQLVVLDSKTGMLQYRRDLDLAKLQHAIFLSYTNGKVIIVGSRNELAEGGTRNSVHYDTLALAADNGEVIWKVSQNNRQDANGGHGEQDHHPMIVRDVIYVEPQAYDINSGKPTPNWKFKRGGHGCGTLSASADTIFFRAGNPTMCDLATGKISKVTTTTRPGCWINIIPAGGMLLIPEASSGCSCNFSVQTSLSFMPKSAER